MDDKKIGQFIRELREESKMSQGDLADLCYVSRTVVGRWELGKISVTSQNLIYLSKIFDISVDELLAGERKSKDLPSKISDITLNEIDKNAKLKKILKRTLLGVLLLALAFFVYFFYTFYNSVQVYKIYFDSNKYTVDYGLVTKMKDKVYFYLDINYAVDNVDDIDGVHLYYEDNSKAKTIKKITNIQPFIIVDYLGYEEYFDFNKFDKILDNMYLEVILKNEDVDKFKVSFKRDYVNANMFLKKENSNGKEITAKRLTNSELFDKFEKIKAIAKNNEDENYFEYLLNNKKYEIIVYEDNLVIKFEKDSRKYSFKYLKLLSQNEYFYFNSYEEDSINELYCMDIQNNNCVKGGCYNFINNYREFVNIIDLFINDN